MGNRAVILAYDTTPENANSKIGVYVHWHGSKESIQEFLDEAKRRQIRTLDEDQSYFWARFVQTVTDMITEEDKEYCKSSGIERNCYECSVGCDVVTNLDTHNYDNGVYYIKDFEIVKHTDGSEFDMPEPQELTDEEERALTPCKTLDLTPLAILAMIL